MPVRRTRPNLWTFICFNDWKVKCIWAKRIQFNVWPMRVSCCPLWFNPPCGNQRTPWCRRVVRIVVPLFGVGCFIVFLVLHLVTCLAVVKRTLTKTVKAGRREWINWYENNWIETERIKWFKWNERRSAKRGDGYNWHWNGRDLRSSYLCPFWSWVFTKKIEMKKCKIFNTGTSSTVQSSSTVLHTWCTCTCTWCTDIHVSRHVHMYVCINMIWSWSGTPRVEITIDTRYFTCKFCSVQILRRSTAPS